MNLNDFLDDYEANQINDIIREFYDALLSRGATFDQIDKIDAVVSEILGE